MSQFDQYPRESFRRLEEIILSDRCWDCDEQKAIGKCPDCDDPGEFCAECLREHQELVHSGSGV